MKTHKNIGAFMKTIRVSHNLSQSEFAKVLKVHKQYTSNWERGICSPPLRAMQRLWKYFKFDRTQLYKALIDDAYEDVEKEFRMIYRRAPKVVVYEQVNPS